MSNAPTYNTDTSETDMESEGAQLTDEERELFERLAERYEGEPLGRIFEIALQSSPANEEANS